MFYDGSKSILACGFIDIGGGNTMRGHYLVVISRKYIIDFLLIIPIITWLCYNTKAFII